MPVERFPAPTGGVDMQSGPGAMPKDCARALENLLVHRAGVVPLRGPLGDPGEAFSSAAAPLGIWVHGDVLLIPDYPNSKRVEVSTGAYVISDITLSDTSLRLGGRSARVGDYAYGRSIDDTKRLLQWDGTSTEPAELAAGPTGPTDVAFHLERLFAAGGVSPAGGSAQPNAIYWTDLGGPLAGTLADWQDDTSGLTNQALVGSAGDAIVGLASVGRQLLVFKQFSVWAIVGDTPSTFQVRQLASSLGCPDVHSIIVTDDYCLFVSQDGPVLYDGATFTRIGRQGPSWANAAHFTSVARLSNDYYVFTGRDETWLLFLPTQAWTVLRARSSVLANERIYLALNVESGLPVAFDGLAVRLMNNVVLEPQEESVGRERDIDSVLQPIDARWTTRLARLGKPLTKSAVQRLFVDHRTQFASGSADGWSISPVDAAGASGVASTVDAVLSSESLYEEANVGVDRFQEYASLGLEIVREPSSTTAMTAVDLRDLWVEYAPAQR